MKIHKYVISTLLFLNLTIYAQDISPIQFDGITPLWNRVVVDSFKWENEQISESVYLSTFRSISKENIIYTVFIDNTNNHDGIYIESRNRLSGEVIWWNYVGENNTGANIDATELLFDENGGYYLFLGSYEIGSKQAISDIKKIIQTFEIKK